MLNRSIAPALAPLAEPALLPYQRLTLENGVEVVYIHDPAQEVFKTDVLFEAGIYHQPQALVASTAINMLNEGTRTHSAEAIADLFDYYGAYMDFNCGLHKAECSLISLNKYASFTLPMMAELLTESVIPEKELEIYLRNKRQEFLVQQEKTSFLARKKFSALLWGEKHPYANQVDEKDYTRLTPELIRNFYRQHINAHHCRILLSGHISEEILQIVSRQFSRLTLPSTLPAVTSYPFHPAPPGRYHIPKENAVQTSLRLGKTGVRLLEEDYAPFMLLNTILGGYFGSRLMSNIREEKGYTYGIQSFNVSMPLDSFWCVTTDLNPQHTEAAIEEILKEIHLLQTRKISDEELQLVKNFLYGDLLRELDGAFSQSDALKHKLNYGVDNQIYLRMIRQIKACSAGDLLALANKYWKPEEFYIVTAGAPLQ